MILQNLPIFVRELQSFRELRHQRVVTELLIRLMFRSVREDAPHHFGSKGECEMLVLSRKTGESIQIAENIRVTVTEVRGGRVRLSIEAPAHVRVLRKEILDAEQPESRLESKDQAAASH